MTCKPESQKQRLERIAVQLMAGLSANGFEPIAELTWPQLAATSIEGARELIKQLDSLPLDE